MRHAELKRQMASVTRRMLTKTLRSMEQDGLLIRREFDEIPPRVEYELTPLGMELLMRMSPVWTWVVENVEEFRKARRMFDSQDGKKPSLQIPKSNP